MDSPAKEEVSGPETRRIVLAGYCLFFQSGFVQLLKEAAFSVRTLSTTLSSCQKY